MRDMKQQAVVSATKALVMGLLMLTGSMTGCSSLTPNDASMIRDMLEVKDKLNKSLEAQASTDRKLEFGLNTLDGSVQSSSSATQNRLDDLDKRLREVMDEVQQLRTTLEEVTYKLEALQPNRLSPLGTGQTGQLGTATPGGTGTDGTAATTPMGSAVDQAINNATVQLNLGQYEQAREGFRQALEMNPTPDRQIEIYYWLAQACQKLNDLNAAYENYRKVIELDSRHAKAWASLEQMANIKLIQGNPQAAKDMLNQIVERNGKFYPDIDRVKATLKQIDAQSGTQPAPDASSGGQEAPAVQP